MSTVTEPRLVFTVFTHVTDETGEHHAFAPGQEVPGWVRGRVGDHVYDVADEGEGVDPNVGVPDAPVVAGADIRLRDEVPVFTRSEPEAPPTSGNGSSRPAWAKYARELGESVTAQMSRQDIIDMLIRHGRLTDLT